MDVLSLSEQATADRFNVAQDRVIRDFGYGQTAGALAVSQDSFSVLSDYIQAKIDNLSDLPESDEKEFLKVIRHLPVEVIAMSALNAALDAVAMGRGTLQTRLQLGYAIGGECWSAGLLTEAPELAKRIDRAVRRRHGSLKYRKQAAHSIASRAGYRGKTWSRELTVKAGIVLMDYVLKALPNVFQFVEEPGAEGCLTISDNALDLACRAVEQSLCRNPVFFPCTVPPKPWTGWHEGGYWDERTRLRAAVIRTHHKETAGAIRAAMSAGAMKPHLDALNALQAVAWTVNTRVLEVLKWAYEAGVDVAGLPPKGGVPLPEKPCAWADMDDPARRLWKYRVSQVKERNRSFVSNRVLFVQDTATAERLTGVPFWTPLNCDWRGRVYGIPHFNFQRDDRVRALFLFADGMPIGADGLFWLKVHLANCGDFDKISKRSLKERAAWTESFNSQISLVALQPTAPSALAVWTNADKPFLFLAACMELTDALEAGPQYVTRLPVSFDGSCSGLQHLAAMTRDEKTGALVNLCSSSLPQDVYEKVAGKVTALVAADANQVGQPASAHAEAALTFGIDRKMVKRNVMTYSYSSKKFGMAQQLSEDLMRPLAFDVLSGKLNDHPFGPDDGRPAAKYLAAHIYDAIETLVTLPARAMTMLQKCARALAHEGKPVTWTTPLGMPWINRYHAPTIKRLSLWLHDTRVRVKMADGHEAAIDKDKAANGVAPNFVHALDAAHLLMTANACASENITQLATVHDSFGCLAPQATRFNQIIREQFVALYTQHDVLKEVLDQSRHDLTVHNQQRLPFVPEYGEFNLTEVLNADFAFS